jgi:hypothetical protein
MLSVAGLGDVGLGVFAELGEEFMEAYSRAAPEVKCYND